MEIAIAIIPFLILVLILPRADSERKRAFVAYAIGANMICISMLLFFMQATGRINSIISVFSAIAATVIFVVAVAVIYAVYEERKMAKIIEEEKEKQTAKDATRGIRELESWLYR